MNGWHWIDLANVDHRFCRFPWLVSCESLRCPTANVRIPPGIQTLHLHLNLPVRSTLRLTGSGAARPPWACGPRARPSGGPVCAEGRGAPSYHRSVNARRESLGGRRFGRADPADHAMTRDESAIQGMRARPLQAARPAGKGAFKRGRVEARGGVHRTADARLISSPATRPPLARHSCCPQATGRTIR